MHPFRDLPESSAAGDIEWDRLLGPAPAAFTKLCSEQLAGKRVLLTGAGGSIGAALAYAVWASSPERMVLLDTSENGLYQVDRRLREAGCRNAVPVLASVCDQDRLARLFAEHRPQIVLHAAALKHVPLMERNPFAAIETNAVGTLVLAKAAAAHWAEHLVLVSTDKAVDPRSIMGASKRIAELILLALGPATGTRMTAVRLGNVLGSQGSVLPLFEEQIARGGPLTVTHPDAERYFMTMNRAVAALLNAIDIPTSPALVVPKLGEPIRILHLARRLLEAHSSSAAIEFTGLRPGDKMTESLLSSRECWSEPQAAAGLHVVAGDVPSLEMVEAAVQELNEAALQEDLTRLLRAIATLVPEYEPSAALTVASQALA